MLTETSSERLITVYLITAKEQERKAHRKNTRKIKLKPTGLKHKKGAISCYYHQVTLACTFKKQGGVNSPM